MTEDEKNRIIDKYREHLERAEGGIFSKKGRNRLLGQARPCGGDESRTTSNFWRRTSTYVKNALVDLELFIEMGEKSKVREVITAEALNPIFSSLLWTPIVYQEEPDRVRAEIATLLIRLGFNYLKKKTPRRLSLTEDRTIDEAVDLSQHLLQYFKPEDERRFPFRFS